MKCVVLLAAGVLLIGCAISRRPLSEQYDLGDLAVSQHVPSALAVKVVIRDVSQPSWLRNRNIFYRFDYMSPSRRQHYAMSEWIADSGELITFRLREAVASANAGFTLPRMTGAGGYILQANLEEFTQAFETPVKSRCIVQLRATLLRSADLIVAQRVFHLEIPAQTPDASGAALCLASAVNQETGEIVGWLSDEVARAPLG